MNKIKKLCLSIKGWYEDTVIICGFGFTLVAFVLYPLVFIIAGLAVVRDLLIN